MYKYKTVSNNVDYFCFPIKKRSLEDDEVLKNGVSTYVFIDHHNTAVNFGNYRTAFYSENLQNDSLSLKAEGTDAHFYKDSFLDEIFSKLLKTYEFSFVEKGYRDQEKDFEITIRVKFKAQDNDNYDLKGAAVGIFVDLKNDQFKNKLFFELLPHPKTKMGILLSSVISLDDAV